MNMTEISISSINEGIPNECIHIWRYVVLLVIEIRLVLIKLYSIKLLQKVSCKFYSGNSAHIFLNLERNKISYQITFYFKSYLQRGNTLSSQIATM